MCVAISKKGPTKIAIFKQNLNTEKFKKNLKLTIKPFANKHYPYGHRLLIDRQVFSLSDKYIILYCPL